MARNEVLRDKFFYKSVLQIMVPVALQQAINMGVNMMDTVMLGSFGDAVLSASSLANTFYNLFIILCMGIVGGCSVLAAQYWGAGSKAKVRDTFNLGLRLAAGLALVFSVVTFLFPGQIMALYSKESDVIADGMRYLKITAWIYIFHGTSQVGAILMRSVKKPQLGLYVSIISFVVNIGANWIFIFGHFGAPAMGIAGAALGTLIARIVEFIVTFVYIFCIDRSLMLRPIHLLKRPTKETMFNYRRLGAAALVSDGLLGLGMNVLSGILGRMGSAVVSANAVCMVVDRLFTVVVAGVGNASSVIVGNTIGAGQKEKALKQGEAFYILAVGFGIISSILLALFGELTIGLYNLKPETVVLAEEMMLAYAVVVLFQSVQTIMTKGVLRGGGDTKFLLVADVLFMWLVSLPLGYVVGVILKAPAWLTIICLRSDYVIKSVWCLGRLRSGKWIRETQTLELASD